MPEQADIAEKMRFVELRAQGKSINHIAEKLGRGVSTIHAWIVELDNQIQQLKDQKWEELTTKYKLSKEEKLKLFGKHLGRVTRAIEKKIKTGALDSMELKDLYDLQLKLYRELANEGIQPIINVTVIQQRGAAHPLGEAQEILVETFGEKEDERN